MGTIIHGFKNSGQSVADLTLTTAITDNTSTTQAASTAYAKSQDAVLAREPDQGVALQAGAVAAIKNTHSAVFSNTTNSFGIGGVFALPLWTPAANQTLRNKWATNVGYKLEVVLTSGAFALYLNDTVYTSAVPGGGAASNLVAGTKHSILAVPTVGATHTTVSFYIDGVLLSTTAAQNNEDVTNTSDAYTGGHSTATFAMTVYDVYDYNRALTAAEVLDLYRNGIAESDKWGSQTSLNSATLENTASAFPTFSGASATGFHAESNEVAQNIVSTTDAISYVAGKLYRISFTAADLTGTVNYGACEAQDGGVVAGTAYQVVLSGVNNYEFSPTSTSTGTVLWYSDGVCAFTISSFSITEIGATLCLIPENIQPAPGQWLDASSNKLHAMQPATGSSLTRPKDTFTVKWTNTWAASHEAQYIGGVNQAVLPVGCYIESIIGVVTGGTIEDIIIGDGSDTDHWVEATTGLAAGTYSFAIANRISDGSNFKMTVDPDNNMTGSIAWTIKGIIL